MFENKFKNKLYPINFTGISFKLYTHAFVMTRLYRFACQALDRFRQATQDDAIVQHIQ